MTNPSLTLNEVINLISVFIVPLVGYLGYRLDKRLVSIDEHMQTISTKVALHDKQLEGILDNPRSWDAERDLIKDQIKSLQVRTR